MSSKLFKKSLVLSFFILSVFGVGNVYAQGSPILSSNCGYEIKGIKSYWLEGSTGKATIRGIEDLPLSFGVYMPATEFFVFSHVIRRYIR